MRRSSFVPAGAAAILVLAAISFGLSPAARSADMSDSEKVVRQFLSAWDARNLDAMMTAYGNDSAVICRNRSRSRARTRSEP